MASPVQPPGQPAEGSVVSACPLCGGTNRQHLWTIPPGRGLTRAFALFRCTKCQLAFTSPRPSDTELVQCYDEAYYGAAALRGSFAKRLYEIFFRGRRKQIERHVQRGRLLDIGCGDGRFVHYMAAHGWEAVGFDISPIARALARQQANDRVRILGGRLTDHHLPERSFDLITLWQVLEHIGEPLPLLRHLARLLKPGGLIVIAVPNLDSVQAKMTGAYWWGLDVPRHLTHYAPGPLRRVLTAAGFLVRRVNHFSFRYSAYALFQSLLDRLLTRRDFLSDFAKRTLPSDLGKFEYSYNVAALTVMSPLLAPVCILDSLISSSFARGGFIEAYATVERR